MTPKRGLLINSTQLELVIQHINENDIAVLEKSVNEAEQSFKRGDVSIAGVSTFHLLITKDGKNPVFEILVGSLLNLGLHIPAKGGNRSEYMSRHFKHHREILETLCERDLEKAKKVLKNHILHISERMEDALKGRR